MVKVGIIGATGYAGAEIVRILLNHPDAKIVWYGSRSYKDEPYASVYGSMFELVDDKCMDDDMDALAEAADVIFTATPQGYCAGKVSESLLGKCKVVDISADYRIKDAARYEAWYGIHHPTPEFLPEAVYGLPELFREKIRGARLIANPGCFPTCSVLSIFPWVKAGIIDPDSVIIDAKSGTSGAGRGAKVQNLFCEVNENIKAYGVTVHRHTPEIEDQLSVAAGRPVTVQFTPHLVPMNRGILVTAYAKLLRPVTKEEGKALLDEYYAKEKFVRVLPPGTPAETRRVKGSNYADVGFFIDERTGRLILTGAIDNVVKGAAGQAVQNMNILFGLPEDE
ncbi:MAG: N-acetyl-gamma-glutamyl-phosphate reductase, partial [Lachnospiraceae bacterium]